jgi:hypothetical protein
MSTSIALGSHHAERSVCGGVTGLRPSAALDGQDTDRAVAGPIINPATVGSAHRFQIAQVGQA